MTKPPSHEGDLFRVAFDLSPSGMLAVDQSGQILLANREAERSFGYGPGELRGRQVEELVPAALRAGHHAHRTGFFRDPGTRPMGAGRELHGLRQDGTEFPIELGLNPVQLPTGMVVIASVVDTTARKEAERQQREQEERIRQVQKLESLGTLAGGIAHDFNNVLLGIVGFAEFAQDRLASGGRPVGELQQIQQAAERGRQLVRRILLFTRKGEVTLAPMDLGSAVREATELLQASLASDIAVRLEIEEGLPPVRADETLVHQIVMNLGTNAGHAMEGGGQLSVSVSLREPGASIASGSPGLATGKAIRLAVADQGAGMTPEVRARLFEPFFTTKAVGKGTGLGMPVVLGIVQRLGGAIAVDSNPGRGTQVEVWLPICGDVAQPVAAEPAAARSTGLAAAHVLVVEDQPMNAELARRRLESLGLRVTVHESSLAALADFRSRPQAFDLMLTDNSMPGMTGLMLAKHVTSERPSLPVLMVSGYAENADLEVLRQHGIATVLRKPHSLKDLGEAIQKLLARR